ncbi:MAG: L,D-transpeptidase family protein [Gemmatimonadota bacterium]|nr:L,D-transpeptidase family protein [Gemmatimonadota bacterium]
MNRGIYPAMIGACLLLAAPLAAQGTGAVSESIRARVNALQLSDGAATVLAVPLQTGSLLSRFYAGRNYQPAWTDPNRAGALLQAIRASRQDGLEPRDYLIEPLERLEPFALALTTSPTLRADFDLLATEALIRLWSSLTVGKVDPTTLDTTWHIPPPPLPPNAAGTIEALATSDTLALAVAALAPRHPLYLRLRNDLAQYRALESAGGWESIDRGPNIEEGDVDARIPSLRRRLAATGDLDSAAAADSGETFMPPLTAALTQFQARHGLYPDGVLGPRTIAELNVPVSARIETLRINLERGRWVLRELGSTFVAVNIAGFESYFVRNDTLVWRAPSIVGQPFRQTPEFRATMTYLVVNPTWTVPQLLLDEDVFPAVRRDSTYLATHAMRVLDWQGNAIDPATIDWHWYRGRSFPYRIVQAPGGSNPLGRIKFMFPNPYAVYLHDTPARALFRKPQRTFSSGCIRVEHPMALAELLLEGSPWTPAALDSLVAAGAEQTIPLPRGVPVVLLYWTAWSAEDGTINFRSDVYHRDAAVLRALDAPFDFRSP